MTDAKILFKKAQKDIEIHSATLQYISNRNLQAIYALKKKSSLKPLVQSERYSLKRN